MLEVALDKATSNVPSGAPWRGLNLRPRNARESTPSNSPEMPGKVCAEGLGLPCLMTGGASLEHAVISKCPDFGAYELSDTKALSSISRLEHLWMMKALSLRVRPQLVSTAIESVE